MVVVRKRPAGSFDGERVVARRFRPLWNAQQQLGKKSRKQEAKKEIPTEQEDREGLRAAKVTRAAVALVCWIAMKTSG